MAIAMRTASLSATGVSSLHSHFQGQPYNSQYWAVSAGLKPRFYLVNDAATVSAMKIRADARRALNTGERAASTTQCAWNVRGAEPSWPRL
ncbi:hypothetical protein E2562_001737 [Oryza meyeriana var. granulata]|uniref:Uncharacterized protein n=1 Tax=Oryza meyeriana var. granulata TaxID=110450 RepID=A0A6G1CD41_9ORYZ|nr:hypothetical protein E2562_001737 [Oryza meyeriana var. granulata]